MKRLSKIIISLFLLTIFFSCNNSVSPEFNERFAIFLLKSDSLLTKDVENITISSLQLRSEPILTFDDIVSYELKNHKVYLNNSLTKYLGQDSSRVFSNGFGIPFILVANGERIYLGSFITGLSSWSPNTPKIIDYTLNRFEKSFLISGAPIFDIKTYSDIRNDNRILFALDGKLKK
jgi:hypothetical protein